MTIALFLGAARTYCAATLANLLRCRTWRAVLCVFLCTVTGGQKAFADEPEPSLATRIDQREKYLGESFTYQVMVLHVASPPQPDLSHLEEAFVVRKVDERSRNERIIQIRNGSRTETMRYGREYLYQLTPKQAGVFSIEAPTLKLDNGTTVTGSAITVRVVGLDAQTTVLLSAALGSEQVYLSQPVTISLTVAIRALPGTMADKNPLLLYASNVANRRYAKDPPELTVPWLNDEQLPDGLLPKSELSQLMSDWYNQRGIGFQVNGIGRDRLSSLFRFSRLQQSRTVFQPQPKRTRRVDGQGEEGDYWEYTFARTFLPRDIGTYVFQPATIKGMFLSATTSDNPSFVRSMAATEPLTLQVVDAPRAGRPTTYTGGIGSFELATRLSSRQAHVGDPLQLEIELRGEGTLDRIQPLDLSEQPGVAENFRFQEPTEQVQDGARLFRYRVRPLNDSVKEFPAVSVSYFDTTEERYVTLRSPPIPLSVVASGTLQPDDILSTEEDVSATDLSARGPSASEVRLKSIAQLRDDSVHWQRWIGLWSAVALGYACGLVVIYRARRLRQGSVPRQRAAVRQSLAGSRRAAELLKTGNLQACHQQIRDTLVALISEFTDNPSAGATVRDIEQRMRDIGCDAPLVDDVVRCLEHWDAVQFGAEYPPDRTQLAKYQQLLERLWRELRASP